MMAILRILSTWGTSRRCRATVSCHKAGSPRRPPAPQLGSVKYGREALTRQTQDRRLVAKTACGPVQCRHLRCNSFEQRLENRRRTKKGTRRGTKLRDHLNVNLKLGFYVTAAIVTFVFMTPNLSPAQTPQSSIAAATRGERALGFDQGKAVRHFKLLPDGGAIEINANDPADVAAIRQQVANVAAMFGQGKFEVPPVTSGQNSPVVDRMSQLKGDISYAAENLPAGGE
jgi:hypothetical protein